MCRAGCEHEVEGAAAYPLVRPGETVVYDASRRDPANDALCLLQWNSGSRSVLLTNRRTVGNGNEPYWFVDPVNRPSSNVMMDRRIKQGASGAPLYASDGPYKDENLRAKIVGTVVGVLVRRSRCEVGGQR